MQDIKLIMEDREMNILLWAAWIGCCVACYYLGKTHAFNEARKRIKKGY